MGIGYVGLPLGMVFANKKNNDLGFDLDEVKVNLINKGNDYLKRINDD